MWGVCGVCRVVQDGSEIRCDVDFSLLKAHVCGVKDKTSSKDTKDKDSSKEHSFQEGGGTNVRVRSTVNTNMNNPGERVDMTRFPMVLKRCDTTKINRSRCHRVLDDSSPSSF